MLRTPWFVIVAVAIAMSCQSFVVDACAEQSEGNTQQIIIRTKLIEINRSKLRRLGVDFAGFFGEGAVRSAKLDQAKTIESNFRFDGVKESPIATSSLSVLGFLDALCQNEIARILSDPTIITVVGRAATLSSGSTIQIDGPPGDEKNCTTDFIGTKLEVVPHLVANNKIRIGYRLDYSSLRENADSESPSFPKIGHTMVDTTFEVSPGETFVSGGLLSQVHAGDQSEHFEIVLLLTPELVGDTKPNVTPTARVSQSNLPGKLPQ